MTGERCVNVGSKSVRRLKTFPVSKAPGLSAISLKLSQRYFKEFVKQTRVGNV